MLTLTFVIPNRDNAEKPPTLYEEWASEAVPRQGEGIWLNGEAWRVKWVEYVYEEDKAPQIRVRLIEPGHWSAA